MEGDLAEIALGAAPGMLRIDLKPEKLQQIKNKKRLVGDYYYE